MELFARGEPHGQLSGDFLGVNHTSLLRVCVYRVLQKGRSRGTRSVLCFCMDVSLVQHKVHVLWRPNKGYVAQSILKRVSVIAWEDSCPPAQSVCQCPIFLILDNEVAQLSMLAAAYFGVCIYIYICVCVCVCSCIHVHWTGPVDWKDKLTSVWKGMLSDIDFKEDEYSFSKFEEDVVRKCEETSTKKVQIESTRAFIEAGLLSVFFAMQRRTHKIQLRTLRNS